jgi:hypothetical protein
MKALIQILFSASAQKSPEVDADRVHTQPETKMVREPGFTMLFPMSLTLEGYHVCGGPVFE